MLPTPLTILLEDQVKLIIEGAACFTRKHVATFDGSTYRNTFPNQAVSVKPVNFTPTAAPNTDTASLQVAGTPGASTVVNTFTTAYNSRVFLDDVIGAVEPRFWKKVRTRVEFWDELTVGRPITALTVSTTSGSATITVPDNTLLTPGQAISGSGIPANTIIAGIPTNTSLTVTLSNKASATADVTAVLTGSNYLGGFWEDEALGDGVDALILL